MATQLTIDGEEVPYEESLGGASAPVHKHSFTDIWGDGKLLKCVCDCGYSFEPPWQPKPCITYS